LENLYLDNTGITIDGLMLLKDLQNLRRIGVMKTGITNADLEKFKRVSASKSVKANFRINVIVTEERGSEIVDSESPQVMGKPPSIVGKTLLNLKDLKIELSPDEVNDKAILVCFFDMQQRPSRHCVQQLAQNTAALEEKGIIVVAIQASKIGRSELDKWIEGNNISFPVGMIQGDEEKAKFAWGVRSLPWLILTDKKHIVTAEGFALTELDEKLMAK
jgi:hypothetical protein